MRLARVVAVAGLAAAGATHDPAAAAPATGIATNWLAVVASARSTETDPDRIAALDAASARFADESKGFAEDLRDLSKAMKSLAPVYEGDPTFGDPLLDGVTDQTYLAVVSRNDQAFLGAISAEASRGNIGAAAALARQSIAASDKLARIAVKPDRAKRLKKLLPVLRKSDALIRKYGLDVATP